MDSNMYFIYVYNYRLYPHHKNIRSISTRTLSVLVRAISSEPRTLSDT